MAKNTDTKDRIIQASKTLFSTHGCQGTTLDDIITAGGVTKGAFYHYFKSKDELCVTIIELVTVEYKEVIDSLPAGLEPIESLRLLISKLVQLNASGEWVNCRLILRLSTELRQAQPEFQQKLLRFWQGYTGFLEELIMQCRAAGQIKTNISPKIQTNLLVNLMAGTIMLEGVNPSSASLLEMTEAIIATLQS